VRRFSLVLPALIPGVSVDPAKIARSLFLLMLLQLAGALAVNAKLPDVAARVNPALDRASNVSLMALIALLTLFNLKYDGRSD
jgi:BASS family bile acid:Na+ symporter